MNAPLIINDHLSIPADELHFSFARSSGPGGQNVNKVSTKAVLRWAPGTSTSLPKAVQERFVARFGNRLTTAGELILTSDRYRHRPRNVADCLDRLRAMLLAVATPPRRRRPTRIPRGANESRLRRKKQHSQKKEQRRRRDFD